MLDIQDPSAVDPTVLERGSHAYTEATARLRAWAKSQPAVTGVNNSVIWTFRSSFDNYVGSPSFKSRLMHGLHLWDLLPPGQAKEARECESTLYFTFSAILGTLVDRDADYVGDKLYPMMENLIKLWLVRQANKLKSASTTKLLPAPPVKSPSPKISDPPTSFIPRSQASRSIAKATTLSIAPIPKAGFSLPRSPNSPHNNISSPHPPTSSRASSPERSHLASAHWLPSKAVTSILGFSTSLFNPKTSQTPPAQFPSPSPAPTRSSRPSNSSPVGPLHAGKAEVLLRAVLERVARQQLSSSKTAEGDETEGYEEGGRTAGPPTEQSPVNGSCDSLDESVRRDAGEEDGETASTSDSSTAAAISTLPNPSSLPPTIASAPVPRAFLQRANDALSTGAVRTAVAKLDAFFSGLSTVKHPLGPHLRLPLNPSDSKPNVPNYVRDTVLSIDGTAAPENEARNRSGPGKRGREESEDFEGSTLVEESPRKKARVGARKVVVDVVELIRARQRG